MWDLETMYVKHVEKNFDLALDLGNSADTLGFDAMPVAGQNATPHPAGGQAAALRVQSLVPWPGAGADPQEHRSNSAN